ncbi:MAG: 3-methyl-2-oxobutanoate dehydrogenase subunit VorB [bacterium]
MSKILLKGCEAIGEAAVRAGAIHYFAYPITPQTEVAEYLARRMPEVGGVFLQAESEVAASNMIFGAASAGVRVFTTSSSPGISLMSEAMSYIVAAELPAVFVNIVRNGPGLGGILPSQGDYFQATRGGGHGDYRLLVLAPSSVQETVEHVMLAFELADKYRNPVMVLGDGLIGQMMEPVDFSAVPTPNPPDKSSWATTGCKGRKPHLIKTLFLDPQRSEEHNRKLAAKYEEMRKHEVRFEKYNIDSGCEISIVAYGTAARVCKTAVDELKEKGTEVGLFRPITLFPYPYDPLREIALRDKTHALLVVEMNTGQMIEDVRLAVGDKKPIAFYGRQGGFVPSPEEVIGQIRKLL